MTEELNAIFQRLNILRSEAEFQDFKLNRRSNYKWELGINVFYALQATLIDCARYFEGECQKVGIELMGLPIVKNYEEPDVIKLWQEIIP